MMLQTSIQTTVDSIHTGEDVDVKENAVNATDDQVYDKVGLCNVPLNLYAVFRANKIAIACSATSS